MHQFVKSIYVVCCRQQTTTYLIYKMSPLSNNFNSLPTKIFLQYCCNRNIIINWTIIQSSTFA